jgi:hypothetical protein
MELGRLRLSSLPMNRRVWLICTLCLPNDHWEDMEGPMGLVSRVGGTNKIQLEFTVHDWALWPRGNNERGVTPASILEWTRQVFTFLKYSLITRYQYTSTGGFCCDSVNGWGIISLFHKHAVGICNALAWAYLRLEARVQKLGFNWYDIVVR